MKTLKIASVISILFLFAGCGGLMNGKAEAEAAVTHFHALLDEGKLEAIWQEADASFRNAGPRAKFEDFLGAVRGKLGKVTSTSNGNWNVQTFNLKTTVSLKQETVFEKGKGTESFRFKIVGTNAVLLAYHIESMDLITK